MRRILLWGNAHHLRNLWAGRRYHGGDWSREIHAANRSGPAIGCVGSEPAPAVRTSPLAGPCPMTGNGMEAPAVRRDRFKQLLAFCEAVRLGSFSDAAKVIGSSQSAVSVQVRALEEEFGTALFCRRGTGIAPTRAGRNLRRVALPLVQGLQRLPDLFEGHRHESAVTTLRIAAGEVSGGAVLPELVKRFQERHPEIRVEVRMGVGTQRLAWLRNLDLDVVATAMDVVPDDIRFHRLARSSPVLITPRDHALAGLESIAIAAVTGHRMIALPPTSYMRQFHDVLMLLHGARPRIVLELEDWSSMLNSVAAGVGIAIVPDLCVSAIDPVQVVRIEHSYGYRYYGLAVRANGIMARAASRFVEFALSDTLDAHEVP